MVDDQRAANAHTVIQVAGGVGGDINLRTGAPVRNRYRHQVARIAPPELVGRDAELAELAEFCTAAESAGRYRWWQAGPWSGKTALLAWFALHPPPGARVVSFFVTARLAGQATSTAFVDNLLEQLLVLLGEAVPPFLSESTREAHVLALLDEAAEACAGRGETLVLLVDGLDEDRGVTAGPDAHSIAALLPASPAHGLRVLVAGRPDPPVPSDVPDHHPLRSPDVVRSLATSPRAQAVRTDMERELGRLLSGAGLERDLLGFLVASSGGLTAADLAALTTATPWQVDSHLATVTGRTFTRRGGGFVLGHEELVRVAVAMLGPAALAGHRDRLHAWADDHAARGWPADTPEYLLVGYPALLAATCDLPRATALCVDLRRTFRVIRNGGGAATVLAEVDLATAAHLSRADPDLVALARLAVHREQLAAHTRTTPRGFAELSARLGRFDLAEALVSRTDGRDRVHESVGVAEAFADAELWDRASALAEDAVRVGLRTRKVVRHDFERALAVLVRAGRFDRVDELGDEVWGDWLHPRVDELGNEVWGDWLHPRVACAYVDRGEEDRARRLVARIDTGSVEGLHDLALFLAHTGDTGTALDHVRRAELWVDDRPHRYRWVPGHDDARLRLAELALRCGDRDLAVRLAESEEEHLRGSGRGVDLVLFWLRLGRCDRASSLAAEVERSTTGLAVTLARVGELDLAVEIALDEPDRGSAGQALTEIALCRVQRGETDRAAELVDEIIGSVPWPPLRDHGVEAHLPVEATLLAGRPERKRRRIADVLAGDRPVAELFDLLVLLERVGPPDAAARVRTALARRDVPGSSADPALWDVETAYPEIYRNVARGRFDQAERVARAAATARARLFRLAVLQRALRGLGERDRADRLLDELDHDAEPFLAGTVFFAPVFAVDLAAAGRWTRAWEVADRFPDKGVLPRLAVALVEAGRLAEAEQVAARFAQDREWFRSVFEPALALGLARDPDRRREAVEVVRAALISGEWRRVVVPLAVLCPEAVAAIDDELTRFTTFTGTHPRRRS